MKKISLCLSAALLAFTLANDTASAGSSLNDSIEEYIGIPYKWGGMSRKGMDCSGFILTVYNHFNIDLPRTSREQAASGRKVDRNDLEQGDLVFFNTFGNGISHAGIYIGNGKFAHASSSRGVSISSMDKGYFQGRYVTARRITDNRNFSHLAAADKN